MLRLRLNFALRSSILAQHDMAGCGLFRRKNFAETKKVRSSMRGSPELPTGDLGENRIKKRFPHRFCQDTLFTGVHAAFQSRNKPRFVVALS